jgi:hypothetical protein
VVSNEDRVSRLDELFRRKAQFEGEIVELVGELGRAEAFRGEGATSTASWLTERYGISIATARTLVHVGDKAWDLPHLVESLRAGDVSLDKVRAVVDVATPERDKELCDQARRHSVRELADMARTTTELASARSGASAESGSALDRDRRSLRFNDGFRTMTVQLPPESYAETRICLETRARSVPSDGATPWDQRCCDAFLELIRSPGDQANAAGSPYVVVAHVPLTALVGDGAGASVLAGELHRGGLIDGETIRRVACDATIVVAVDDDVGHTMYEGRARRFPTDTQRREVMRRDRQCRFPGCTNVTFANVHHIVPWGRGGRTDLENLVVVCLHHHHLLHSRGWTMSGDANDVLTILGPSGRVMTSRPSPLWTTVSTHP